MKTRFYLVQQMPMGQNIQTWFATFDTRTGPQLTKNKALAYTFETAEKAEAQRYLYEHALQCKLEVTSNKDLEAKDGCNAPNVHSGGTVVKGERIDRF